MVFWIISKMAIMVKLIKMLTAGIISAILNQKCLFSLASNSYTINSLGMNEESCYKVDVLARRRQ